MELSCMFWECGRKLEEQLAQALHANELESSPFSTCARRGTPAPTTPPPNYCLYYHSSVEDPGKPAVFRQTNDDEVANQPQT